MFDITQYIVEANDADAHSKKSVKFQKELVAARKKVKTAYKTYIGYPHKDARRAMAAAQKTYEKIATAFDKHVG